MRFVARALLASACALVPALALADPSPDEGDEEHLAPSASSAASAVAPSASASSSGSNKAPHPLPVRVPEKDGMLIIPAGKFSMGAPGNEKSAAPNERPLHAESLAAFEIDKIEVSVGAYRACVEKRLCAAPKKTSALCTYDLGDALLPVNCVTWADAAQYCTSIGKRLPREAEWEYAARGSTSTRYPWGNGPSCGYASTLQSDSTGRTCTGKRPSRVGSHPQGASVFGVQDLSGNVEEWTSDFYVENLVGAAPRSGASHVLRGGGWLSSPSSSRVTSRNWGSSIEAGANVGFRCAKDNAP